MTRSTRVTRRSGGTAVALIVLIAASHTAAARPDGGPGTRQVRFTTSAPTVVGGDFGCDPTDQSRCAGTFRNVRTLAGDFSGTTYQVGSAAPLPNGNYLGNAIVQFTGTVAQCGTGTLVIRESGFLDPVTGENWGTWEIIAGQGTDDLAEVSGSGTGDTRHGDTSTGTIRCR